MGNTNGKDDFNLEWFINHTEVDTLASNERKCLVTLCKLYKLFEDNPNIYNEYKENEEKISLKKNMMSHINKEEIDIESLNNPNKNISKAVKYQLIIANLILKPYKDINIYFLLIKLVRYILNETDFFKIFVKNCVDQIYMLIKADSKVTDIFIIEACELLILVLEKFKSDLSILISQIPILYKICDLPKKLSESEIVNNLKLNIAFGKLLNKCISLLVFMQNKAKISKYETKKELNDFNKNIVDDLRGNKLYASLVNSLTTQLLAKIIDSIKPFDVKEDIKKKLRKNKNYSNHHNSKKKNDEEKNEEEDPKENKLINDLKKKIEKYYDEYYNDLKDIETFPFIVLNIFKELSKLSVVFEEKIINPEEEIRNLLYIVLLNKKLLTLEEYKNPIEEYNNNFKVQYYMKLVVEILGIIISYYISFCLSGSFEEGYFIYDFNPTKSEIRFHDSVCELFNIFKKCIDYNIRFLICSFFFALSYNNEVWKLFLELNVINDPKTFIILFIQDTFNKTKDIESNEEVYKIRLNSILKFIEVGAFLTNERIYYSIKHIDLFKYFLDPFLLLFYINCPLFRTEVTRILNIFTLYDDCKLIILEPKNKIIRDKIFERLDILFEEMKKGNALVEDLDEQRRLINKNKELSVDEFKVQLSVNEDLLANLENFSKQNFIVAGGEFCHIFSIFTNLMMTNRFDSNLEILCNKEIDKYFLYNDDLFNNIEDETTTGGKDEILGRFLLYHIFFLRLNVLKTELTKIQFNNKSFAKFIFQLPLSMVMYNPTLKIFFTKGNRSEKLSINDDNFNLNYLIELISLNKNDHLVTHKLIFACHRFFCKQRDIHLNYKSITQLNEILLEILTQSTDLPLIVPREIFRLFITLSSGENNLFLWLKFENNISNLIIDYSNNHDLILKYMNDNLNWGYNIKNLFSKSTDDGEKNVGGIKNTAIGEDQAHSGKIIILPYRNIKPFEDKYGIIIYGPQQFVLPKPLELIQDKNNCFTIFFRFFNPVIKTNQWHTLLQNETGLISLIAIDPTGTKLGIFNINGEFINSNLPINDDKYKNKWLEVAMVFKSTSNDIENNIIKGEIEWYLSKPIKDKGKGINYEKENNEINIYQKIMYIGNSRDYNEPFGIFCDLRIFRDYKYEDEIASLFEEKIDVEDDEDDIWKLFLNNSIDKIVDFILKTKFLSYEVIYFITKFFNNLMVSKNSRAKFLNFQIVMKLCDEGFSYTDKDELKKELSKYLKLLT